MKYICSFSQITSEQIAFAGGKGASLSKMAKADLNIPEGFIILACAFENGVLRQEASEELSVLITGLCEQKTYAVRSSGLSEDGEKASFAGGFETVLDVAKNNIPKAVEKVIASSKAERVKTYSENMGMEFQNQIAVVIQEFVKPDFAGVLFTADPISGSSTKMVGNFVRGVGELLVSGDGNAEEFTFSSIKYAYCGSDLLKPYAKDLFHIARKIRKLYGCAQDIEWAIEGGKVHILQARPITTIRRINYETYEVNGSMSGEFLFSNTNVGEAFPKVITPVTFSIAEFVGEAFGLPVFIDNICGHPYANLSVIYSLLVSFGIKKRKAVSILGDVTGNIPKDVEIPVFPISRRSFIKAVLKMFKRPKNKYSKMGMKDFIENGDRYAFKLIDLIRSTDNNESLLKLWNEEANPYVAKALSAFFGVVTLNGLFDTREKLVKMAGEEIANALCSNCGGDRVLESMQPLVCLEKVVKGEMTKAEYARRYGHRSPNEMELSMPYPYEDEAYIDKLIEEYCKSGISASMLRKKQQEKFIKAKEEFLRMFPKRKKWLENKLSNLANSMHTREELRSKGVRLFCIFREFLLKCGSINGIGDGVFFLYFNEAVNLLQGDRSALPHITERRRNYERYKTLPTLPTTIRGRFDPFELAKCENRRIDYYGFGEENSYAENSESEIITGYAGAAGIVEGTVRVLNDFSKSSEFMNGEILVTVATNIGWTPLFPRASAIITDIGAPLSHAVIVAREFGIPAVVGCRDATLRLKTGDRVRVDGGRGIVKKV
ncbi:PEP/pyruvate-binding domain-containing protein [Acetivibrio cellulolyticus]|uniref:PEP/pyruvate-binding domain-containing protein n=1 Tax=Acetivibrio cellulolyticus TaxID=35830 RepID=UPI0001E2C73A|nr:PEP/pyruvate-binding domain-containing protein [Acetivibrio cellulolyticus]